MTDGQAGGQAAARRGRRRAWSRGLRRLSCLAAAGAVALALEGASRGGAAAPLTSAGLLGNSSVLIPIGRDEAMGSAYVPGSNVLRLRDGRLRFLPTGLGAAVVVPPDDAGALAAVAADRAWLAAGFVPGSDPADRAVAERALLDLRLLQTEGGGELAAAASAWHHVWPRDSSFAAAAFAATGHHEEAARILAFLDRTQRPDGTWPARSEPDGRPVEDGRPPQLDATGWVPWATWFAVKEAGDRDLARRHWPMVRAAADAAVRSIGRRGLPDASPDYAERHERLPTLGTAAPLAAGLRAAAGLGELVGQPRVAASYRAAAARITSAIEVDLHVGSRYQRTPLGGGIDAAVTWLAPPFAMPSPGMSAVIRSAAATLSAPSGGMIPSREWAGQDPWTPATAAFALAAAAMSDTTGAERWLGWLSGHRTRLGALPERVDQQTGAPRSVAPLAWTSAQVLLAIVALAHPLPVP